MKPFLLFLALQAADFRVGDVVARAGESISGTISITPSSDDRGSFIPVTVVRGARPGPVLALVAGIHGSEYAPILALQALRPMLDPAAVAGTVVVVHVANVPAFQGRTIYVGPLDRKNLNRSFPGKAEGTLTERIAHAITAEVLAKADYVLDIHSGDANESLRPSYTGYYAEAGGPEVIEKSRELAVAFGLEYIVKFRGDLPRDRAIWCGSAAVALGIPAIDVESGELGRTESARIEPIVQGALRVMKHLKMLGGEPTPARNPLFIESRSNVVSELDGIWYSEAGVQAGQYVRKDALLRRITDYFGRELLEVRAPASGLLLMMLGTPPVNGGDTVAVVAAVE
jgi:predicted deacylase